jgi:hypothetical protein
LSDQEYVLLTNRKNYFVEYLIGHLVLSDSITEAMKFSSWEQASKFKIMLYDQLEINCSINTFIKM